MLDTYLPDPPPPPPMTLFQMNTRRSTRPPTPKEFPPNPTIKAAAITTKDRRGTLLMVADYSKYAQYQPPQSATNNLKLLVPGRQRRPRLPDQPRAASRPLGRRTGSRAGTRITLEDFGVTAIVLVTTNVELKDQIEQSVNADPAAGRQPGDRAGRAPAGLGRRDRLADPGPPATPRRTPPPCSTRRPS